MKNRDGRANLRFADNGGIAQFVERLVRNEYQSVTLTFSHLLLSALSQVKPFDALDLRVVVVLEFPIAIFAFS
jgi:hypothetical protein